MNDKNPDISGQDFPEDLPQIGEDEEFCFECGPQNPCFNRCCSELNLPLTPYDALRLTRQSGMTAREFLGLFANFSTCPDTGFPQLTLRMVDGPEALCPFVTPAGCSVYEDRPSACRCYPLGRGSRLAKDGVAQRFFVLREEHCKGFECRTVQTPRKWLQSQEMAKYTEFNDRYMRLLSMVCASGKPLDAKLAAMAMLCLYQLDDFREFTEKMKLFDRLDLDEEQKQKIMAPEGDEAALSFALDWLELVIFGQCANLRKKV